MYKVTGIDIKNNLYKVLDTASNIENICTREQLLQSKDMGFTVFGVLPDDQVVVWDTFCMLSLLSDNGKKKLIEVLSYYSKRKFFKNFYVHDKKELVKLLKDLNVILVTNDIVVGEELTGYCTVINGSTRTYMLEMFKNCNGSCLDLSSFDTSKVTNMSSIFQGCRATSLDLSGFSTSNVTNMSEMFDRCNVASLDLSSFDTSKVTNMRQMFSACMATNIDLSSFDTSKVTSMRKMFDCCVAISLDLRYFDTSKVEYMACMFRGCYAESLDLRNFNTSKVYDMAGMFDKYKGKEIILRKSQTELIRQVKKDGQEDKLCIR